MPRDPETGKYYAITSVKFSHDSKFLVASTSHGWIQLYNMRSGRLVCQAQADTEISCLAVSPSNSFLAAGLTDGRVNVFEIQEAMALSKSLCRIA